MNVLFLCRGCVQFVPECPNQGFPLLVGGGRSVKHLGNIACHGKFWLVALSQNILELSALIQTSKSSSDDMKPRGTWTTPVKRGATTRVSLLQIRNEASGFNVNLCSRVTRCRFHTCKTRMCIEFCWWLCCCCCCFVVVVDLQAGCLWEQDGDSAAVRVKLKSGDRTGGCDELCQLCCQSPRPGSWRRLWKQIVTYPQSPRLLSLSLSTTLALSSWQEGL